MCMRQKSALLCYLRLDWFFSFTSKQANGAFTLRLTYYFRSVLWLQIIGPWRVYCTPTASSVLIVPRHKNPKFSFQDLVMKLVSSATE